MRHVCFNHVPSVLPGLRTLLTGAVLLLVCLLLAGRYWQTLRDNTALAQQVAARQQALQPARPRVADKADLLLTSADTAAIAQAQSRIQTPWLPLFNSLEAMQSPQVYWMLLAPDVKRQHIRMTVLTEKRASGWQFLERLKQQPVLRDIKLNSNETSEAAGLRLSAFDLEAAWVF